MNKNHSATPDNQFSKTDFLGYVSITIAGLLLGAIAYSTLLQSVLRQYTHFASVLQSQWMASSYTVFSWLASSTFIFALGLGLFSPFILLAALLANRFRKDILPKEDPFCLQILNQWTNFVLICFGVTLLCRALETTGII